MRLALFVFALVSTAGCTHASSTDGTGTGTTASEAPAVVAAPVAESRAKGVVIATVVTHDTKVSILGRGVGRDELRVIVQKTDGALIADGISIDDLRRTNPTLHTLVTQAIATGPSGDRTYVDATLDRNHDRRGGERMINDRRW
jgi:hypothetical protein